MSIPKLEWNIQGLLWFYFGCFQGWRSHSLSGLLSGSFSSLFGKNFSPVQQGISLVATWCHSVCSSAGYLWKSLTQSYSWTPAWWWEAVVSFSRAFLSSQGGWTPLVLVLFLPGMMYSAFTDRLVHPRHKHWFIKLRRSRQPILLDDLEPLTGSSHSHIVSAPLALGSSQGLQSVYLATYWRQLMVPCSRSLVTSCLLLLLWFGGSHSCFFLHVIVFQAYGLSEYLDSSCAFLSSNVFFSPCLNLKYLKNNKQFNFYFCLDSWSVNEPTLNSHWCIATKFRMAVSNCNTT